jgi:ribosome-binding protein aMBF1 (putative translation factor)
LPPPPSPGSRKNVASARKNAAGARQNAEGARKNAEGANENAAANRKSAAGKHTNANSDRPTTADVRRNAADADVQQIVRLDGLAVRRRRHDRGWSARDLVDAIQDASFSASGLRQTLTPNQIQAIEEREERIAYSDLLLLADGLACDPSDLIAEGEMSSTPRGRRLH